MPTLIQPAIGLCILRVRTQQCLLGTFEPHTRLWSQILLTAKGNDMASNMATDVYEEAHEASKEYPHVTLALAAGFGFLLGVLATRR